MSKTYIVRNGETPVDVTRKFTGGSARLGELVGANPEFPKIQVETSGQVGVPPVITFDPQHWGDNAIVQLPEHWDGNGQVGAPISMRRPTFTRKRYDVRVRSEWDERHPNWSGSNLAYWSQRIKHIINRIVVVNPGDQRVVDHVACDKYLKSSAGMQSLYDYLQSFPTIAAFKAEHVSKGENPPVSDGPVTENGMWYASGHDTITTVVAALRFVDGHCVSAGQVGAPGTVGQISKLEEKEEQEGMAASECTAGPTISEIKEYRYEIQEDDGMGLSGITERWGLPARKWLELAGANRQIPGKYYGSGATRHCEPDRTQLWAGRLLKVPKMWPDPPEAIWPRLKNADGTPYTPGGEPGDVGPGGEGGEGIDPTRWYGDSASGWIWPVLIVGAAALGGVALIGATKKKGR